MPAILIPYPYAAENHQEYNARSLVARNAAVMILDKELTGGTLIKTIKELLYDRERLKEMSNQAKKQEMPIHWRR